MAVPQFVLLTVPLGLGVDTPDLVDIMKSAGASLRDWIKMQNKKVFVVVSGDLAHHHKIDESTHVMYVPDSSGGDYQTTNKISEASKDFDELIGKWVTEMTSSTLLEANERVKKVGLSYTCCGYGGFHFIQELLVNSGWKGNLQCYARPTYFGMMVAHWEPPKVSPM